MSEIQKEEMKKLVEPWDDYIYSDILRVSMRGANALGFLNAQLSAFPMSFRV